MKATGDLKRFFSRFRSGTRSLKATLGWYFLPLSVLPTIFLSIYATKVFEDNTRETVRRRAETERDAFIAEVQRFEKDVLDTTRTARENRRILSAVASNSKDKIAAALGSLPENMSFRVYSITGKFIGGHLASWDHQLSFLPEVELAKVKARGETRERYFKDEGQGIATVVRTVLRDRNRLHGVLEAQIQVGQKELADFKSRREVDSVLLNKDLSVGAASFSLPPEFVKTFSRLPFTLPGQPVVLSLGDVRFSAFLYEMPAAFTKKQKSGYFVLFLSMTAADAAAAQLRVALVYITAFLVLSVALMIFLLSNRIVEPIELLVMGMKRIRTGKNEQIPTIDSPYEIEYLVHSFNEMARNIAEAREALEGKVEELRGANVEIKDAQGVLIQSAKMVSLGQLVAGVAHELNNPIGFISSNMHHLSEYVESIRRWVAAYQGMRSQLPAQSQEELAKLEKELEIDFILKDMVDLTRSCVEGANRTKEIVLGLRTFSRMDESAMRLSDLHEGIRTTLKLLVTELKDRVNLHEEFGPIPDVECNLSQVNQVFMNLISNAAQAIAGRGDIWIRTRRDGDKVKIEVEDNGSGMPEEVRQKIFDPFFTTKAVGKGTGLGLSIAYGLIEKHHGQIEVESQAGKGTRFIITLPLRQPGSQLSTGVA
jgi:two-component system, NtrC family, sensor kinase